MCKVVPRKIGTFNSYGIIHEALKLIHYQETDRETQDRIVGWMVFKLSHINVKVEEIHESDTHLDASVPVSNVQEIQFN